MECRCKQEKPKLTSSGGPCRCAAARAFGGRGWRRAAARRRQFVRRLDQHALDLVGPRRRQATDRAGDGQRPHQSPTDAEYRHGERGRMRIGDARGEQGQLVVGARRAGLVPLQDLGDGGLVHGPRVSGLHVHPDPVRALYPE
jgi:hypothetical protein